MPSGIDASSVATAPLNDVRRPVAPCVPMTVSYTIDGEKSPFTFGGDEERGNGSIGAEVLIDETWTVNGAYYDNAGGDPAKAGTCASCGSSSSTTTTSGTSCQSSGTCTSTAS